MDLLPLAMLAALLQSVCWVCCRMLVDLPFTITRACLRRPPRASGGCRFYEAEVYHTRTKPVAHSFR